MFKLKGNIKSLIKSMPFLKLMVDFKDTYINIGVEITLIYNVGY